MKSIDVEQLKDKLDNGEKVTLIDVRNPQELMRGRIPKSINIPLDEFESVIEDRVSDKSAEIYVYCLSGSRSMIAAGIMDKMGYENVYNLNSGMLAWRGKHYPEVNG